MYVYMYMAVITSSCVLAGAGIIYVIHSICIIHLISRSIFTYFTYGSNFLLAI